MRCPHCAAPEQAGESCTVCGERLDAPPAPQEHLAGMETTAERALPDVPVTPMPDLLTTREELGDVSIPGDDGREHDEDESPEEVRCPSCGVMNSAGRGMCRSCGVRL